MGRSIFVSLGLLVMALSLRGAKGHYCPYGWLSNNGFSYKGFSELKNWFDAELFCRKYKPGCHLPSICNLPDQRLLANFLLGSLNTGNI